MPRQTRPDLEALEDRLAPAPLPATPGEVVTPAAVAPLAAGNALEPAPVPGRLFTTVATPALPVGATATGSGQLFFSVPPPPNPLVTQSGRFAEPALRFPPSGGAGEHIAAPEPSAQQPTTGSVPTPEVTTEETATSPEEPMWYS
jgi:hypothetical protein